MFYQDAERFINEQFFKNTFDGRSKLDIEKTIHDKLVADEKVKDPAYYGERPGVVHVSSLYGCLRGTLLQTLGIDAPPKDERGEQNDKRKLGVFKAGNLFEEFVVSAIPGVVERQREYEYKHGGITLVGRSDFRIIDGDVTRIGEVKSVNSNAFWYRKQEGTLVAWQNQIQLQTYLWLERILNKNEWDGVFAYISKDDCTVDGSAVKFNQSIIDEIVLPTLNVLNAAYLRNAHLGEKYAGLKRELSVSVSDEAKRDIRNSMVKVIGEIDFALLDLPPLAVWNATKQQFQKNWLADYCDHHSLCAGAGWLLAAADEVKQKNKEHKLGFLKP